MTALATLLTAEALFSGAWMSHYDSSHLTRISMPMRVKLAGGVVTDAARAHIVCTAPQKGESSFEVLDDGIYFNYYNKSGFVVIVR